MFSVTDFISVNIFIDVGNCRLREGKEVLQNKSRGKKLRHVIVPNLTASLVSSAYEFLFNTDRKIAFRGHEEGSREEFGFILALESYRT